MSSPIYVSKKVEKMIKKLISKNSKTKIPGILGKWNATVFYINRRKNWLLFNPKTHYALILENISAKDFPEIQEKISKELQAQLMLDGIDSSQEEINRLLGGISFFPTDADRSALGHMNQILFAIECVHGSDLYPTLTHVNSYLNDSIFSLDGASKYTNLTKPKEEMEKILKIYLNQSPIKAS